MPITAVMFKSPKACVTETLISMYNDHIELPKAFHDFELQKNLHIGRDITASYFALFSCFEICTKSSIICEVKYLSLFDCIIFF